MPNALAIIGIIFASMVSGAVLAVLYYIRVMAQPGQLEGFLKSVHDKNAHHWHCHMEKEFCSCSRKSPNISASENTAESHDC